jgi:hypothetical protein
MNCQEGEVDMGSRKTTKAFERGLEGLKMVAPRSSRTWAMEMLGSNPMRKRNPVITINIPGATVCVPHRMSLIDPLHTNAHVLLFGN